MHSEPTIGAVFSQRSRSQGRVFDLPPTGHRGYVIVTTLAVPLHQCTNPYHLTSDAGRVVKRLHQICASTKQGVIMGADGFGCDGS